MSLKEPDSKSERLEARVSSVQKRLIQKAADLQGVSMTDFMITYLQEAAERVIQHHQMLQLSIEDSQLLVDALLSPPEPNEALLKAAKRYQEQWGP
jgi:uncharacterized protein (DUF1778 family)